MNACTLPTTKTPPRVAYTTGDIYDLIAPIMTKLATAFDFHAIVGTADDEGGTEEWLKRVMALADDLEVRAAYIVCQATGLQIRVILAMNRHECKHRAEANHEQERRQVEEVA